MKNLSAFALGIGCVFAVSSSRAIDLKQSKVTQVVNDVEIISAADQSQKNASVNDVFNMPDILKTGPQSRAELVAADETVTRVGANTIFSFDPANRTIDLKQGSLLFHSPHGKGGGTIHTGSATASVLGTTLVITTTPSGGFKVLDLEGSVEVKFLNGLNQKLAPGQMSFVLPGGNQLSPIVVYRLDDVTKNSKLVGGFHDQLASLPLILQQVEKQLAAIKSGKLSDTGLQVGSDANSQGIQVIDPNTLQSALNAYQNPKGVNKALAADALIDQPSLTDPGIPTPPQRIFTTEPFLLPNNSFYLGQGFMGFAAKDIYFDAPVNQVQSDRFGAKDLTSALQVDLSPYSSLSEFDFVAAQNIVFNTSTTFSGLASDYNLTFSFIAGNQIQVASGSTIDAEVANWQWESPALLSLDNVSVVNNIGNTYFATGLGGIQFNNCTVGINGNLGVQTAGDASFSGTSLLANSISVNASGSINIGGGSAVTMSVFGAFIADNNITLSSVNFLTDPNLGALEFNAKNGDLNVSDTSFNTYYLSLNSGDGILLDGTGASLKASTANFTAVNLITVKNADLSNIGYLNAVANTITVCSTTFNPVNSYNFGTATGDVNIDHGVKMGDFNLINDYTGSTPITSSGQINMTAGPVATAGINSYRAGNL